MIKFFRQTRKQLLSDNKIGKYVLYAIGEILLIVIGLFIALQLNNLNTKDIIHKNQLKHLRVIKTEMTNNLNSISEFKLLCFEIMDAERKVISYIDSGIASEDQMSEQLRVITFNELILPLESGALNEVISSGGLKDIENDTIRNILASWEGKKAQFHSQEGQMAEVRDDIIALYNNQGSIRILNDKRRQEMLNIDAPKKVSTNLPLLKLRRFENAITHHLMLTYYQSNTIYQDLEDEIKKLIELIDKELRKSEI